MCEKANDSAKVWRGGGQGDWHRGSNTICVFKREIEMLYNKIQFSYIWKVTIKNRGHFFIPFSIYFPSSTSLYLHSVNPQTIAYNQWSFLGLCTTQAACSQRVCRKYPATLLFTLCSKHSTSKHKEENETQTHKHCSMQSHTYILLLTVPSVQTLGDHTAMHVSSHTHTAADKKET